MEPNNINQLPNVNTNSSPIPIVKTDKKSKTPIFTIIIAILLVGALGFIAWQNFFSKNTVSQNTDTDQTQNTNDTDSTTTTEVDTHLITSAVIEKILDKYNLVSSIQSISQPTDVVVQQDNHAPSWKIEGTNRHTDYIDQKASSLQISIKSDDNSSDWALRYNEIGNYILSAFQEDSLIKTTTDIVQLLGSNTYYTSDTTVCSTDFSPDATSSSLSVNCGRKSKYTTDLAEYILVKPFFDATNDKYNSLSVLDMIVESGKDGYINTYLPAANAAQLFYKAPEGQWTYFMATQNVIACSEYNTNDLKMAFAYSTCYDSQQNTTKTVFDYYGL